MRNSRTRLQTRASWVALLALLFCGIAGELTAHPLGNFSISQYSALRIGKDHIEIRYSIDMAEIPTFQEIQESGIVAQSEEPRVVAYLERKTEILRAGLRLEINGQPIALATQAREIVFPPGAGGLPTLKIAVRYRGALDRNAGARVPLQLNYRDENFAGRAGWKEIIAAGSEGITLVESSVPTTDRSQGLSDYPTDMLDAPPQDLAARVMFKIAAGSAIAARVQNGHAPKSENLVTGAAEQLPEESHDRAPSYGPANRSPAEDPRNPVVRPKADSRVPLQNLQPTNVTQQEKRYTTPRNAFTELMTTKELGWGIAAIAFAVAASLGALHALEPGHGKTLVAAYLVGSRGTMKHALILGVIVTASHTIGVYLLGAVTLYASKYIVPETLYPWLALSSGLLITLLGAALFLRRYRNKEQATHHHGSHDHEDGHRHDHHHGGHSHSHRHLGGAAVSWRELLTLGISGGVIPCPAALVVLLSAVSMQRIGFGLLLIVAFSVGLATVLIAIGMLMVGARQFMSRFHADLPVIARWLPLTSSAVILVFGLVLTFQAIQSTGMLSKL